MQDSSYRGKVAFHPEATQPVGTAHALLTKLFCLNHRVKLMHYSFRLSILDWRGAPASNALLISLSDPPVEALLVVLCVVHFFENFVRRYT